MSTLPTERAIWVGNNLGAITYGIDLYMVFHSWYLLKGRNTQTPRMRRVYISFGFIQFLLLTLEVATNGLSSQYMWIDHRDFPGGPLAYFFATGNSWFNVLNVVCGVLSLALSDALLLYRCYIIWNASWRIMAFPILIYLGEIAMGLFFIVGTAIPNATFFLEQTTNFSVPWISLGTSLNVILTGLIVGRIFYASRQVHSSNYTGVVAILVESAIPLSLSGIAFVITMRANVIESFPLATLNGSLNVLCPQAIIIRVAMGKGWSENTMGQITTTKMEFAERKMEFSDQKTHSGDVVHFRGGELSSSFSTVV